MSCDAAPDSGWPSAITLCRLERTLELEWGGAHAAVPHQVLRAACRCTQCESFRRARGASPPVADDVELTAIEPVGSVGLQFIFSDGHERGIYPWPYLYEVAYGHHNLTKGKDDEQSV